MPAELHTIQIFAIAGIFCYAACGFGLYFARQTPRWLLLTMSILATCSGIISIIHPPFLGLVGLAVIIYWIVYSVTEVLLWATKPKPNLS